MKNREVTNVYAGGSRVADQITPVTKGKGVTRIDGIRRVVWKGANGVVVFQDTSGAFWRYLPDIRKAGPVVVSSSKESA